ncbi:MAG: hypothetical protein A2070_01195 [Bdellovibrionales bacterium GWC1_52_8]|nr:MAG: hypothetical protein A2X97_15145 [Bdellovibrionales bacterium GWA1_52_35]OFZ33213.1 MAG: hypothetical protein A2070_01195 [Bdellovibrionales bacterium GWC1_52_8]HCM40473.1 hypothetical protein [Bdellovibrionales bacterium]
MILRLDDRKIRVAEQAILAERDGYFAQVAIMAEARNNFLEVSFLDGRASGARVDGFDGEGMAIGALNMKFVEMFGVIGVAEKLLAGLGQSRTTDAICHRD